MSFGVFAEVALPGGGPAHWGFIRPGCLAGGPNPRAEARIGDGLRVRIVSVDEHTGKLQLSALPESFCQLPALEMLHLEGNGLKAFPEALGRLRTLRHLRAGRNRLARLPRSCAELQSLEALHLEDNALSALPENIGLLKSLRYLGVQRNLLRGLPEELSYLSSLQTLRVSGNRLESVPHSLTELPALKELQLGPLNRLRNTLFAPTN